MTSPDSLLRLQRQEQFPRFAPRILGVDEFALRKGRTYGTLVVDLERRIPVDLSLGSDAQDLTAWLQDHPQVELLARDRVGLSGWLAKQPYQKPGKWRTSFTWSTTSAAR